MLEMFSATRCSHCGADQHVCRMCEFYDVRMGCNEERAEQVSDIEKANFCDYFKPAFRVFDIKAEKSSQTAKAKLAALFGDPPPMTVNDDTNLSPKALAEKKLRELLGG
jgi:hypothetical protein